MAEQAQRPRRPRRPDPHTAPYPHRLHGHLAGAVAALASLAEAPESDKAALPTPAELVRQYGASEAVITTESEGGENV